MFISPLFVLRQVSPFDSIAKLFVGNDNAIHSTLLNAAVASFLVDQLVLAYATSSTSIQYKFLLLLKAMLSLVSKLFLPFFRFKD